MVNEYLGKKQEVAHIFGNRFFFWSGGTTRGLIDAGGYVIAGIDNDDHCEKTYTENNRNTTLDGKCARFLNYDIFPKTEEYPDGQQDLLFKEIESLLSEYRELAGEEIPLLFAICAPCQPFTRLAKKEMTDERKRRRAKDSGLLHEAYKFVRRFNPEIVLSENVADISGAKFGGIWEALGKELEEAGYVTGTRVVCTSNFGVPQYRKRSILLAVRRGRLNPENLRDFDSASLEISVPESDPEALNVTVKEVLVHLPPLDAGETHSEIPNHRARCISELNYKRLSVAKPGENNFYMENTEYGDLSLKCHRDARAKTREVVFRTFIRACDRIDLLRRLPLKVLAYRTVDTDTTIQNRSEEFLSARRPFYSPSEMITFLTRKSP